MRMYVNLPLAALGAGFLLLGHAAAASLPSALCLAARSSPVSDSDPGSVSASDPLSTPAPTPGVEYPMIEYIDDSNLTDLAKPFMPPAIDGVIKLPSFRPEGVRFAASMSSRAVPRDSISFNLVAPKLEPVDPGDRLADPYRMMGQVRRRNDQGGVIYCTGSLVGTRLFLTARHCVPPEPRSKTLEFVPGYDGSRKATDPPLPWPFGKPFRATTCYGIHTNDPVASGAAVISALDYVVCVLDEPIGVDAGYLSTIAAEPNPQAREKVYTSRAWWSAGYPGNMENGKVLIQAEGVRAGRVHVTSGGLNSIETGPYPDYGWSGGPLFGVNQESEEVEIIGVVSSYLTALPASGSSFVSALHMGGPKLTRLIVWARCTWPGKPGECPTPRP